MPIGVKIIIQMFTIAIAFGKQSLDPFCGMLFAFSTEFVEGSSPFIRSRHSMMRVLSDATVGPPQKKTHQKTQQKNGHRSLDTSECSERVAVLE
uniref:Putative secreted protein n=1 Tax=Anopheles darlingi TaxID=43151 RepID=A0A2M4DAD9_ANODA